MSQKASEKELSDLHGQVAKAMIRALDSSNGAAALLAYYDSEDADEKLPSRVRNFLEDHSVVSPSLLTAITKFLKDNEITADPEAETGLTELQRKLATKSKYSTASVSIEDMH